ncbi:hypothetical protein ACFL5K_03755 [Gemmatimonadota bacterium]
MNYSSRKTLFKVCAVFCLFFQAGYLQALEIPLKVTEIAGYNRNAEAVTFGVPLPRGAVTDLGRLAVLAPDSKAVPAQFETSSTWPDGSAKWLLVDFIAGCGPGSVSRYSLTDNGKLPPETPPLEVNETGRTIEIETGVMRCLLDREYFDLFGTVFLDHDRNGVFADSELVTAAENVPGISCMDASGLKLASRWGKVNSIEIETRGPVRATVAVKGRLYEFDTYGAGEGWVNYTARLHFYAGSGLVRVFFTLENHNPTVPSADRDGDPSCWMLGRPGSFFFDDLSLSSRLTFDGPVQLSVGDGREDILDRVVLMDIAGVYQESSGGENWFHRNHMNNLGKIPLTFRGAEYFVDDIAPYKRNRPEAWLHACDRKFGLAVAVRHFWQNFPKALTASADGTVRVALWPEEFPDHHELVGGEIKTHEIVFFFHTGPQGSTPAENRIATIMGASQHPLLVRAPAEWYLASGFFDDAATFDPQRFPSYERLLYCAVNEERNLFTDIEFIDEYGWRNFGDTWAQNEKNQTRGPHTGRTMVNHYNLEYDFGYGMLLQSLRTLDRETSTSLKWWKLAETGLRHESDIDLYHALEDTLRGGVHNGGKFTHTAHGVEAALAGHRGSPRLTWFGSLRWPWGEGSNPESGHFNNRGLMAYYYLTGDRQVLRTAMEIAELVYWKITENRFPQISTTNRDAGNNLQILTDAYLHTWDEKYRLAAEKIIDSTHPDKQWYTSPEGRKNNPGKSVSGWWTASICINAAARFTEVIEEKTGSTYQPGRDYVTGYADFTARFLAGGPEVGFFSTWSPSTGGRGRGYGSWTYRISDIVMFGHKFTDDPALKKLCLKAAGDAFTFMRKTYAGGKKNLYVNGKTSTMLTGGGHQYTAYKQKGKWAR